MASSSSNNKIGIIGGGVIGLCSAYYLLKEGYEVTVFDQGDISFGCSYLNAGMIVPSHIVPLAAPGVVGKGIKWMFKSDSPFAFHVSLRKDLLRWIWLFNRSANTKNVQQAIPYLRDISWLSKSLYQQFAKTNGFDFGYAERGLMMLYQTLAAEQEEMITAKLANEAGVKADILSAGEVQKLEPELKVNSRGGIYFPGDAHIEPGKFMREMFNYLKNAGISFITNTTVSNIEYNQSGVKLITGNGDYVFNDIVIACGVFSGLLLKNRGVSLPLQGGKGYSFTLENRIKNIHIPSILIEGKVAVTPMGNKLRVSGTMEIGNNSSHINENRIKGILNTLFQFYPELQGIKIDKEQISSGLRPCSPDGLPYIGKLKNFAHITLATGHGMMGMSLGPATGKLVSEIIAGKPGSMDIKAFNPERFS
ncbi:MAG: FAD-dependent oxidoreductase [Chitinophagaceae bacterium]|nr:MAG: FAD-dependent oxidoreductase [Chitinophagaceae bacterium]